MNILPENLPKDKTLEERFVKIVLRRGPQWAIRCFSPSQMLTIVRRLVRTGAVLTGRFHQEQKRIGEFDRAVRQRHRWRPKHLQQPLIIPRELGLDGNTDRDLTARVRACRSSGAPPPISPDHQNEARLEANPRRALKTWSLSIAII